LEKIEDTNTIQSVVKNKNIAAYLPEITDSVIETNDVNGKKIMVNNETAFDFNNGTIEDGVIITLSEEKVENLSKRDVMLGEQKIGQLILARNENNDTDILDNIENNTTITDPEYSQKKVFAESSTNGIM